jgi:hypothetical protein
MVHTLADFNRTLPRMTGRVGLDSLLHGTSSQRKRDPKLSPQLQTMRSDFDEGLSPATYCFSAGVASVAWGGIRKCRRNQSFKRCATTMRRKDPKGRRDIARRKWAARLMTCHKPVLFLRMRRNPLITPRKPSIGFLGWAAPRRPVWPSPPATAITGY